MTMARFEDVRQKMTTYFDMEYWPVLNKHEGVPKQRFHTTGPEQKNGVDVS